MAKITTFMFDCGPFFCLFADFAFLFSADSYSKVELEAEESLVRKGVMFEEEGNALIKHALVGLQQELHRLQQVMGKNTFVQATKNNDPAWYDQYLFYHW